MKSRFVLSLVLVLAVLLTACQPAAAPALLLLPPRPLVVHNSPPRLLQAAR